MSHFLFQFAIASSTDVYGYLTLIACFVAFLIFLLRLNSENLLINRSTVKRVDHCVETAVTKLENPFFIEISAIDSSLADGAKVKYSFLKPTRVWAFWGVSVKTFYNTLKLPVEELINNLKDKSYLKDDIIHSGSQERYDPCKSLLVKYHPPDDVTPEKLGSSPRQWYPLIIVTVLDEDDSEADFSDETPSIVMMFTILHLKDSVCSHSSHIIGQYVKGSDNRVCYLQPLFVPSFESETNENTGQADPQEAHGAGNDHGAEGEEQHQNNGAENLFETEVENLRSSEGDRESDSNRTENESGKDFCNTRSATQSENDVENNTLGECIICQCEVSSVVFLPCRHTCVCSRCLKKLDKCPMCRGTVLSYFRIRNEEESGSVEDNDDELDTDREVMGDNWWENLNNRINNYFGFT